MGSESVSAPSDRTSLVLRALASHRRRRVLAALEDEPDPVSVSELAAIVAATDDSASDDARERVSLVHRELPKLAEADLVEWDREAETVAVSDDTALADPSVRHVVESPDEPWDDVLESLAHGRRRAVLSVLVAHGGAIARRNLARRTLARERDAPVETLSPSAVDDALASLHHVHLPKLRDAGLLVDDGLETVRYADHPNLDAESLTIDANPASATRASASQ